MDDESWLLQRKIIHVDMMPLRRSKRDHPGTGAQAGGGGRLGTRGQVAASYEARKFGVHSAMPSVTAKRNAHLIFARGTRGHNRVAPDPQIFEDYTPLVELLSLDELFDVTETARAWPQPRNRRRNSSIWQATTDRLAGHNKFLASWPRTRTSPTACSLPAMGLCSAPRCRSRNSTHRSGEAAK
jgi:DNA polymerase-4